MMETPERVHLAVSPRIFRDTLALALLEGRPSIVLDEHSADGESPESGDADPATVAVVSGGIGPRVAARAVVRLPGSANGSGVVVVLQADRLRVLPSSAFDLEGLRQLILDLLDGGSR